MNNGVAYADIVELDGAIMAHLLAVLRRVAFCLLMSPLLLCSSRQKWSFRRLHFSGGKQTKRAPSKFAEGKAASGAVVALTLSS